MYHLTTTSIQYLFFPLFLKASETSPLKITPLDKFNTVIEILLQNYFRGIPFQKYFIFCILLINLKFWIFIFCIFLIVGDTCHNVIGIKVAFDTFCQKFGQKLGAKPICFFFFFSPYYRKFSATFYTTGSYRFFNYPNYKWHVSLIAHTMSIQAQPN